MPYATTDDGVKLYFEETGAGAPIVFVHEFAADHRSWEMQMRHFGQRYRCITYGARGYPPSDVPEKPGSYSQNRATDDIMAVMDHLGIDKAHVVGLSMGGFASLHFGFRHPTRARSLVVAGVGYGAEKHETAKFKAEVGIVARSLTEEGMAAFAEKYAYGPTRVQFENKDPARLRRIQEGAGRAFGAGLGQYPARLPGRAAVTLRSRRQDARDDGSDLGADRR